MMTLGDDYVGVDAINGCWNERKDERCEGRKRVDKRKEGRKE